MTLLDLLLAAIVIGSVIGGFITGFTRTAFGIVATIIGVILGFWFYDVPGAWFEGMVGKTAGNVFGFFVVFAIVLAIGTIAGKVVSKAFKFVGLGIVDRLGGAAFGLVRGVFVAAAVVAVALAAAPRPVPNWMRGSALLPYALGVSDLAASLAPRALKNAVSESIGEIKKSWNEEVDKAKKHAQETFRPAPPPAELKEEPKIEVAPKAKVKAKKAPKKALKTVDQ
jgi:membrane protein required for colicin V production